MITLRLWQVHGTDKAYCFSKLPKDKAQQEDQIWIPRSQIEHITRLPAETGQWNECLVKLPEWLAEKKGLL